MFLELVPGFGLYRGLWEISQYAFKGAYQDEMGVTWSVVGEDNGLMQVMIIFAMESVVFLVAAWYLEQVLPGGTGVARHPLFFLGKKYAEGGVERKKTSGKVSAEDEVAVS